MSLLFIAVVVFLALGALLGVVAMALRRNAAEPVKTAEPRPKEGSDKTVARSYAAELGLEPAGVPARKAAKPLPPLEGEDDDVTLETISVGSVTPRLREISGIGSANRVFNLVDNVSIGRSKDNQIVLREDAASGHHCRLERHGASFRLVDLGSTNKSWVNGAAKEHVVLRNGDKIRIGDTTFVFELFGERS